MLHDFKEDRDSIFNYLIITSSYALIKEVKREKREDGKVEIIIHVDGIEVDAERFVNRWQENVARAVEEKAKELLRDKFGDLDDVVEELSMTISDFKKSVSKTVKKKIEFWEK